MNKLTVIDLFSGAGGLSRGFYDAGYNVVIGVDFDDAALVTFEKNHGSAEALKLDLFNLENVKVLKEKFFNKYNTLDVLVGGPPCQGFSLAGKREEDDERNKLYTAMVETARQLRPRAVVLENVPGMLTLYGGKGKEKILKDFEALGYKMNVKVLYAPDYGVPQIRKRAFFVGILDGTKYEFPEPIKEEEDYITCEQAIGDLPSLESDYDYTLSKTREYPEIEKLSEYQKTMRRNSNVIYNHIPTKHTEKTVHLISLVPEGGNYKDLPGDMSKNFKYKESLTRYNSKKPSRTIDTGHRTHFHYKWNRIPTVRENARLQSFPDDFIFYGNKQEQYKQVGNAVPPLLGKAIAEKLKEYLTEESEEKINVIDLFAGCGGLLDGFLKSERYKSICSVEWEKAPVNTLINRLKTKWKETDAENTVIRFDIQRIDELFQGFDDGEYGKHEGLDSMVSDKKVDVIIGGPPCQAYSVAGRVRDKESMKNDYRNYLFEYYMKIVERYKPKLFVFENVPGMLSAMPDGTLITELIRRDIESKGYEIIEDIKQNAVLDASDYGVPQSRKRVILFGLNKEYFKNVNIQDLLKKFYKEYMPKYRKENKTVEDAIGDMDPCYPLEHEIRKNGRRFSHSYNENSKVTWHIPRFHNKRDIKMFEMLAKDIETKEFKYVDSKKLKELYNNITGANTNVHKYHVLRKDKPSTTILAHLHKDGLRFIHYDSKQARSLTVREAARLQSFDDDFDFIGSMGDAYKMIGNAVPPLFAEAIANAIYDLLKEGV